ncbi:unnamed protein product [Somion occarium]|uniref:ERCC1-like central domain-containing protein n=1 Tax=Somion occarium TaxID=3059160 RepID=A0ABP1DGI3_9APHY
MAQPVKPPVVQPGTGNNIIVNPCQRGNPIIECIRNVGKEFGEIVVDYQVGRTTGILFLSLRYHRLHPEYIHQRIQKLGHAYNLRVLLIMCDVSEHQEPIPEEAGFYLSTFKQFEHKPPDLIKERVDKDYDSMLRTSLTSISKVNKTDVETLRTTFGSFADIAKASSDQLLNLPGFGQVKVKRIKDAFEKPFRNNATSALPFAQFQPTSTTQVASTTAAEALAEGVLEVSTNEPAPSHPAREPRPVWDIELDLNESLPPSPESGPLPIRQVAIGQKLTRQRSPSPMWDIELDLDEADVEQSTAKDKFGQPALLS